MNEISIRGRLIAAAVIAIPFAMFATTLAYAEDNECKAVVKFLSTSTEGAGTKFTFDVKTNCDVSTGSFEYAFKNKGKVEIRNSPAWTSAEGKMFKWTDYVSVPVADVSDVKVSKVKSTNVQSKRGN